MSAFVRISQRRPAAPAPFNPRLRARIEDAIEVLIHLLDAADPDPDLEPSFGYLPNGAALDECEPDHDAEAVNEDGEPFDEGNFDSAAKRLRWRTG